MAQAPPSPWATLEQTDFSGGINRAASSHMLEANEMFDIVDGIIDTAGRFRRRGPITDRPYTLDDEAFPQTLIDPATLGTPICAARYSWVGGQNAVFLVTAGADGQIPAMLNQDGSQHSAATTGPCTYVWYIAEGEAEQLLFVVPGITAVEGAIANAFIPRNGVDSNSDTTVPAAIITFADNSHEGITVAVAIDQTDSDQTNPFAATEIQSSNAVTGDASYNCQLTSNIFGTTYWALMTFISVTGTLSSISIGGYYYPLASATSASQWSTSPAQDGNVYAPLNHAFRCLASNNNYVVLSGCDVMPETMFISINPDNALVWDPSLSISAVTTDTSRIKGIAPIGENFAVIKETATLILTVGYGSPAQGATTGWSVSQRAALGTYWQRSVTPFEDTVLFANDEGVFAFDGVSLNCLTDKIWPLWRAVMTKGELNTLFGADENIKGVVFEDMHVTFLPYQDYLFVSVTYQQKAVLNLLCYLQTGVWMRLSPFAIPCGTVSENTVFTYAMSYSGAMLNLSTMITNSAGQDSANAWVGASTQAGPYATPNLSFVTGALSGGDVYGQKKFREIRLQLGAPGNGDNTANVFDLSGFNSLPPMDGSEYDYPVVNISTVAPASANWPTAGGSNTPLMPSGALWLASLPAPAPDGQVRVRTGVRGPAMMLAFTERGNPGASNAYALLVYGLRLSYRPMRQIRSDLNFTW